MKTFKLIIIGIVLFLSGTAKAQVSVNINIGSPPMWGPVGYTDVRYYYLPDVEAYYDIHSSMFIYYVGGGWIHRTYLPDRYRSYDLYNGYKVVMMDYRGNAPYSNFNQYKVKYKKGYRGDAQKSIGVKPVKENSNGSNKQVNNGGGNSRNGNSNGGHQNSQKSHGNGGGKGKKK